MDRALSLGLGVQLVVTLVSDASVETARTVARRVLRSAGAHHFIEFFAGVVTDG
jgi:hypothetical protein